ncbi:hypothetical protein N7457_008946 [Penicillium paradoxum]|uniref:uncharacterized protein n=1 Tax=Penicillium paradoxum TaxID=176176 RepID=UPI002548C361|nr:uncharacterized protein N7457_008946 [Penicillium paradoxum]KAJ5774050.1 hypothetical protein N7457_008946 [Penicillium paradoxum]
MPRFTTEGMASRRHVHLPTEVLVHIANFIYVEWSEDVSPNFQATLYRFCLVSRQWYSAGIEFLYSRPQLDQGNSFSLFTNTVCPSVRSRERKVDLGSFVQILNLGLLVHHSSNSLTARLLGRVKKNLKTFVAPRVSFAINSLAPLSKCKEISYLCLNLVVEPIALSALKKAISGLNKLESLELPSSMFITDDGSGEDWPPNLKYLQVGGRFDAEAMPSFRWPPNLASLTLCGSENLNAFVLENILINEQLCTTLTSLTIHRSNREMFAERSSGILGALFALKSLRIPIDLLYGLLILPAFDPRGSPTPIRELELTAPYDKDFTTVILADDLCKALKMNLSRVCGLGISPGCLEIIPESSHAKIDKWVWKNIDQCPEDELDSVFDLGLYVIDSEPSC